MREGFAGDAEPPIASSPLLALTGYRHTIIPPLGGGREQDQAGILVNGGPAAAEHLCRARDKFRAEVARTIGDWYIREMEIIAARGGNIMPKSTMAKSGSPSRLIDAKIEELNDWRGKTLAHVRALIKRAVPQVVEEWKWRGVPVWYHEGMICTGETYKSVVKLTFAKGASLEDPSRLFNSSLEGNVRRAIDIREGEEIDEDALTALICSAAALNKPSAR